MSQRFIYCEIAITVYDLKLADSILISEFVFVLSFVLHGYFWMCGLRTGDCDLAKPGHAYSIIFIYPKSAHIDFLGLRALGSLLFIHGNMYTVL
jgi:hypothetical protein